MCAPQLLQLQQECGFKPVKMRKPKLMASMILQLYNQFPSKASAPNHGKVKRLDYARMEAMAGSLISGPIVTKKGIKQTRATDLSGTQFYFCLGAGCVFLPLLIYAHFTGENSLQYKLRHVQCTKKKAPEYQHPLYLQCHCR